jgi:hypothetical protein
MHPNEQTLERFYASFSQRDYAGMIACYAPEIRFADEVFTLSGKTVGAMWHMLCESGKDLAVIFRDIHADEARGTAHWEATYTFSATGRKVLNIIDAEFDFSGGQIIHHRDRFSFWRWSRQALGPTGLLLGWTPFVQRKVQRTAARNLSKFIQAHPQYQ